jgi:hypothetical protein
MFVLGRNAEERAVVEKHFLSNEIVNKYLKREALFEDDF